MKSTMLILVLQDGRTLVATKSGTNCDANGSEIPPCNTNGNATGGGEDTNGGETIG